VTPTTIVIGTGYVGKRFVEQQADNTTLGLSRSPGTPEHPVAIYDLDVGGPVPLQLPDRYSVLYTVPPANESLADVRLQRLLKELQPPPERFVYISTTGVYGNRDGGAVDEETAISPEADRALRRVSAENSALAWGNQCGCTVLILRVPGIYGPQRLGLDRIREGKPVIAAPDTGPGNRIHVDDLVTCCIAALSDKAPAGIYNVGDGDLRSSTWFTNEVARQAGLQPPPTISMADAAREFSPMRMSFLRESRRVCTQKMRDVLGVTLRYPNAEDGIAASLVECR
jgi:nucleoside-diphosphate-sugar epimerase